jgi:hypothetical protein
MDRLTASPLYARGFDAHSTGSYRDGFGPVPSNGIDPCLGEDSTAWPMRHVVEAGTDAASLLLFDPGALPADFDRPPYADTVEILERISSEGRASWIATDRDGSFVLHAYVDEPIPEGLRPYAHELEVKASFSAPTGRIIFCGSEYAFREDGSLLQRFPQMGSSFTVRPGSYRLTLLRMNYPDGYLEQRFRETASPWQYRVWMSMRWLIPLAVAAWIGLFVIIFIRSRVPYPRFLAPLLGLIIGLPFLVTRLETYRSARERFTTLEQEQPWGAALLEYLDGD